MEVNQTLLNDTSVNKEIKKEIKIFLELNEMKPQYTDICEI